MTVGPWVDRAWVGLLPDASKFVPEANRAITKALNDIERRVAGESGRITRRFDDMARGANRALDGIGRDAFDGLRTDADRAAHGVNDALDGIGRHAFDGLKTDADRAARGVEDAFDGVGDRAFDGLKADANRAAEDIEAEFRGAERESDRALRGIGGPGQFRDVERQADRAGDRIGHSFLRGSSTASFSLGSLTTRAHIAGGLIGAALGTVGVAAVKMGLDSAAAMEQAEISFGQLLGSGRRAKDFLAELNRFGAATPFELPGLIATSRQLLGAGQAAKDIIPILTAVGDATGALGLDQQAFERIMLAVTQAMNKGRLQGEELMQMQEAGLPVTAMLAKALGVTTKQLLEQSQAGKLQSDVVLPKLFDQMHKDYGGSMIKQSRTLNGLWSTFVDTTRNALREGIQPLLPAIKDALPNAARILEGAIRSVVSFFRDDLGPELGRVRDAWDENGAAITRVFTTLDVSGDHMSSSKDAARSLGDVLTGLVETLGNVARAGENAGHFLNSFQQGSENLADSINDRLRPVWDGFLERTAIGAGGLRIYRRVVNDVKLDLQDVGVTLGETAGKTDQATTAADRHTGALRNEKTALDALTVALDDQKNADIQLRQAKLNLQVAQKRVTDLARDGKKGSFEYRQAQLDLERAQIDLRHKTDDYRVAQRTANAAVSGAMHATQLATIAHRGFARAAYDGGRAGLKFGDQVRDGLLRIPKGRIITVDARARLDSQRLYFSTSSASIRERPRAEGGPIYGSGTDTSDSILAAGPDPGVRYRLSRDEHVWTAEEVRRFGGHQAMEAWRKRIRTMDASMWQRVNRLDEFGFQAGGSVPGTVGLRWRQSGVPEPFNRRLRQFRGDLDKSVVDAAKWDLTRLYRQLLAAQAAAAGGPTWQWLWAQVHAQFPHARLISGFRPGARTHATGAVSYHALGKAIDVTPSMAIFNWIARTWGPQTAELIFSPAGSRQIHNGARHMYSGVTRADHWNHVHWAMRSVPGGRGIGGSGFSGAGLSPAEAWIIARESGGRTTADNPTSTAFGLGQLLLANRIRYGRMFGYSPSTTNYSQQLTMFRAYVRDRYGTAEAAKAFWQSHGWYRAGGPIRATVADRGLTLSPGLNAVVADNRTGRPEQLVPATRATTVVNIQSGAVQISVQGPVSPAMLPQITSSVEDGLHAVLREFRTGTAA